MVSLVLFVMTPGVTLKLLLSVVNLSFHLMVSITLEIAPKRTRFVLRKIHQPQVLFHYKEDCLEIPIYQHC